MLLYLISPTHVTVPFMNWPHSHHNHFNTATMMTACSSGLLVHIYQTAGCHIPETNYHDIAVMHETYIQGMPSLNLSPDTICHDRCFMVFCRPARQTMGEHLHYTVTAPLEILSSSFITILCDARLFVKLMAS